MLNVVRKIIVVLSLLVVAGVALSGDLIAADDASPVMTPEIKEKMQLVRDSLQKDPSGDSFWGLTKELYDAVMQDKKEVGSQVMCQRLSAVYDLFGEDIGFSATPQTDDERRTVILQSLYVFPSWGTKVDDMPNPGTPEFERFFPDHAFGILWRGREALVKRILAADDKEFVRIKGKIAGEGVDVSTRLAAFQFYADAMRTGKKVK